MAKNIVTLVAMGLNHLFYISLVTLFLRAIFPNNMQDTTNNIFPEVPPPKKNKKQH